MLTAMTMLMSNDAQRNNVEDAADDETADVTLFVKAGSDGHRYGACPFCQRVFMILLIKSQAGLLRFKVVTVSPNKPPESFRQLGLKHVPGLAHGDIASYDNVDDIIQYLDDTFPGPDHLMEEPGDASSDAQDAARDIFLKFCFYIKEVARDPQHLLAELSKLNAFLEAQGNRGYLFGGDRLSHLDCELLPKLQHLRVASKALKGLDLPVGLDGLWRYIYKAYSDPVFTKTCPSDQEIILHWADRPDTPNLNFENHAALIKATPKYTFHVPAVAHPVTVSDQFPVV